MEKGLSQDELRQILNQLRNITRPSGQPQSPPQSYPIAPNMSAMPPPTTYSQYSCCHTGPPSTSTQSYLPQPAYPQGTNRPSVPVLPAVNDIANLYSLVNVGVVGVTGTRPAALSDVNKQQPESTDSSSENILECTCELLPLGTNTDLLIR